MKYRTRLSVSLTRYRYRKSYTFTSEPTALL
jgi:hypothetical protein